MANCVDRDERYLFWSARLSERVKHISHVYHQLHKRIMTYNSKHQYTNGIRKKPCDMNLSPLQIVAPAISTFFNQKVLIFFFFISPGKHM